MVRPIVEKKMDDRVLCPKCGSAQLHAEKRGWTLLTGFIGSAKVRITCLKCGKRFKPGHGYKASKDHFREDINIGLAVFLFFLVVFLLFWIGKNSSGDHDTGKQLTETTPTPVPSAKTSGPRNQVSN